MPVETPSLFSRVIQEHLELKRRNAGLDGDMPLERYMQDDPFSNHPLFKSEEQARLEETMDGPSVADVNMLLVPPPAEETAEHPVLAAASEATQEAAATLEAPIAPAPGMLPAALPADETAWGRSRDFDWGD